VNMMCILVFIHHKLAAAFSPPPLSSDFFFFWDRVSLCSPRWPQTHNPPASASCMLGLQACTTAPNLQPLLYGERWSFLLLWCPLHFWRWKYRPPPMQW
jgi:hypothetical protein